MGLQHCSYSRDSSSALGLNRLHWRDGAAAHGQRGDVKGSLSLNRLHWRDGAAARAITVEQYAELS